MAHRTSTMHLMVPALLIAGSIMSLVLTNQVTISAQSIQPTGQLAAETQNPQAIAPQNFGAASNSLQQSTTAEVLGASVNQSGARNLTINVSRPPALLVAPTTTENILNEPQTQLQDPGLKLDKIVGLVAAFLVLLAGVTAIYLAAKRSMQ